MDRSGRSAIETLSDSACPPTSSRETSQFSSWRSIIDYPECLSVTNRANLQVDSILKFPRAIATLRQSSGRTCVDLIVGVFRWSVINDQRFVSIRANDRRFMLGCCHRESLKTKTPPRNTLKQLDYPHVPPHTHTRAHMYAGNESTVGQARVKRDGLCELLRQ